MIPAEAIIPQEVTTDFTGAITIVIGPRNVSCRAPDDAKSVSFRGDDDGGLIADFVCKSGVVAVPMVEKTP